MSLRTSRGGGDVCRYQLGCSVGVDTAAHRMGLVGRGAVDKQGGRCLIAVAPIDQIRLESYYLPPLSLANCARLIDWRPGRVVEGTSLLRKHMGLNLYRGFESLGLRQDKSF